MTIWLRQIAAVALTCLCFATSGRAAITYSLGFEQSNYFANPGDAVSVRVFLTETVSGGDVSRIMNAAFVGLTEANIDVVYGDGFASNAEVRAPVWANAGSDADSLAGLSLLGDRGTQAGSVVTVDIGAFNLLAPATPGTSALNISAVNLLTIGEDPFGANPPGNFAIVNPGLTGASITAVPEPSALGVLSVAAIGALRTRRRRV